MLMYQFSLQHFGEVVTSHFLRGAVLYASLLMFDLVGDEEILHVNMTVCLSAQVLPVPFHEDHATVILVHNILVYLENLTP